MKQPRLTAACVVAVLAVGSCFAASHFQDRAYEPPRISHTPSMLRPDLVGKFTNWPDARARNGGWSYVVLTEDIVAGSGRRDGIGFRGDARVWEDRRAVDSDYTGSGWARGHLEPVLNYGGLADIRATFNLSNVVPMNPALNSGLWSRIEAECFANVKEDNAVEIWTGPLYLPENCKPPDYADPGPSRITFSTIGKHQVWVPTHLGKAMLVVKSGKPHSMRAWIARNSDPPAGAKPDDCLVTVDALEPWTPCDLYDWLPDDLERRMEAER